MEKSERKNRINVNVVLTIVENEKQKLIRLEN